MGLFYNYEERLKENIRRNLPKRHAENKAERRYAIELIKFDLQTLKWWRKSNKTNR